MFAQFLAALGFLTRIPVPQRKREDLGKTVWAFPMVGLVVGVLATVVYAGASFFWPPPISALLAIAAQIFLTGALHEDGLADTGDGFGGGASRERKLEIMHDSRVGTYGALALIFSVMLRAAALVSISDSSQVAVAILAAAALSRGAVAGAMAWLPFARHDGLAFSAGRPNAARTILALAFSAAIALVLLPPKAAAITFVAAGLAAFAVAFLAKRAIGGQTGDVLGAAQQAAEIAMLLALAAIF